MYSEKLMCLVIGLDLARGTASMRLLGFRRLCGHLECYRGRTVDLQRTPT